MHNPSGKGVAIKASASKTSKVPKASTANSGDYETVISSKNTAKRNIVRKNNAVNTKDHYDNKGKKMGGAGKGQWGNKLSDHWEDYDAAGEGENSLMRTLGKDTTHSQFFPNNVAATFDKNDPLYDETEESYVLVSDAVDAFGQGNGKFNDTKVYGSVYTQDEFKRRVSEVCVELYSTNLLSDTVIQLKELLDDCPSFGHFCVKKCIEKSLDFGSKECELTSQLLVRLVHINEEDKLQEALLTSEQMELGFEMLLESLEELLIDCPGAANALTSYFARAIVDEALCPSFLTRIENDLELAGDQEEALSVIVATKRLLSREHGIIRLEHVWGPGDGTRSISELKKLINQILKEYLVCSLDIPEAILSIEELNVCPFFAHELVKQAIVLCIEHSDSSKNVGSPIDSMIALLAALHGSEATSNEDGGNLSTNLLTVQQLRLGLSKFASKYLNDLELDVPNAKELFKEFCTSLQSNPVFRDSSSSLDFTAYTQP